MVPQLFELFGSQEKAHYLRRVKLRFLQEKWSGSNSVGELADGYRELACSTESFGANARNLHLKAAHLSVCNRIRHPGHYITYPNWVSKSYERANRLHISKELDKRSLAQPKYFNYETGGLDDFVVYVPRVLQDAEDGGKIGLWLRAGLLYEFAALNTWDKAGRQRLLSLAGLCYGRGGDSFLSGLAIVLSIRLLEEETRSELLEDYLKRACTFFAQSNEKIFVRKCEAALELIKRQTKEQEVSNLLLGPRFRPSARANV